MPPMRILHTADVHLRNNRDERWHALGAVIETAAREGANVLAIAGDLFDRDVDAPALKAEIRRRFEHYHGRVVLIPGNHDERGIRAGDHFGENVRVLAGHDTACDIDGVRFVGVPYEDLGIDETLRRLRAAAKQRGGGTNVLLYHGELLDLSPGAGAFGEEDAREYMPARLSDLAGLGFDYVLAGHFHRAHDVRPCGGGHFVYSGSPVSITKRETGRRHATLIDVGEAPRSIALDTHHFVAHQIVFSPGEKEHPVSRLERELSALDPRASALVTVRGFVDLSPFGMRENEFHLALKEARARFNVVDFDSSECLDVGVILNADLFRRFVEKLARSALSEADRDYAREMAIRAMMEAPDAR
jgi:DNA repair exonuclease SbcCD nuclease subunit